MILIYLGMFSNRRPQKQSVAFFKSLRICHILLISGSYCISGSIFAYQHSAQLTLALRTYCFTLGAAEAFFMFFYFGLNTSKIRAVHHKLQELVNNKSTPDEGMTYVSQSSKFHCFTLNKMLKKITFFSSPLLQDDKHDTHDASNLYWNCERKWHRLMKSFLCYALFHVSSFLPVLISALFGNFNGKFDGSAYNLPFNEAVPFNLDSISGWLLAWFYQFNECVSYGVEMITVTTCFSCFCYYIMVMCDHFNLLINSIRLSSQGIHSINRTQNCHQIWVNVRSKLQRAIELHIDIYE